MHFNSPFSWSSSSSVRSVEVVVFFDAFGSGSTPLHLAIHLSDASAARSLASAGVDASLQNAAWWNSLLEELCWRNAEIAFVLLEHHHRSAWLKWRCCLPRVIVVLRRMHDFYMEISFHFESSVIPFVGKIAPSGTYQIWKRDKNLWANTCIAGFDGLKIQHADQSILFLGEGDRSHGVPEGSLLVLNHDNRKIFNAFENAGARPRQIWRALSSPVSWSIAEVCGGRRKERRAEERERRRKKRKKI